MKKNYVFAPYLSEEGVPQVRLLDLLKMTHLNIAFGEIKDGVVSVEHLNYLHLISLYKTINPNLKISLSIGGWAADGFSQAAFSKETRSIFTSSIKVILDNWDFDGIDIDWEYPCSHLAGIAYGPYDKENFTLLLQDLRDMLDTEEKSHGKKYLLTAAVGADADFIANTQMDKVAKILDYVYLMTYDLRSGFTNVAGHHASLYAQTGCENGPSTELTVKLFHQAGVPYEKMVVGVATYGRLWTGISPDNDTHGLGQVAQTTGSYFDAFNVHDEATIRGNGFERFYDEQAHASYLSNGTSFVSYEDVSSIKAKCNFVKSNNLAGIMYWVYGNTIAFDAMANEIASSEDKTEN